MIYPTWLTFDMPLVPRRVDLSSVQAHDPIIPRYVSWSTFKSEEPSSCVRPRLPRARRTQGCRAPTGRGPPRGSRCTGRGGLRRRAAGPGVERRAPASNPHRRAAGPGVEPSARRSSAHARRQATAPASRLARLTPPRRGRPHPRQRRQWPWPPPGRRPSSHGAAARSEARRLRYSRSLSTSVTSTLRSRRSPSRRATT